MATNNKSKVQHSDSYPQDSSNTFTADNIKYILSWYGQLVGHQP